MTILKDEEGNLWEHYEGYHPDGINESRLFRKLPKKRVPFEEVDRVITKFSTIYNNQDASRLLARAIVAEALAQMEEKAK